MELEALLPGSRETTTGLCPKLYEWTPQSLHYVIKINFNIIIPHALKSPKWSLPFKFPIGCLYAFHRFYPSYLLRPSYPLFMLIYQLIFG
jgi:hypothetical protein